MRNILCLLLIALISCTAVKAKTLTYNQYDVVNLRDQGIPTDERSTNVLIADDGVVYGASSGFTCHVYRFDPSTKNVTILASIDGPNTILKGMVKDGDTIYVGTMLTKEQLWWEGRRRSGSYELADANLYEIDDSWGTGHLYKITGVTSKNPEITDLGIPVEGQGIYTMAMDKHRNCIYGMTYPTGRFFIYDITKKKTETIVLGSAYSHVSNHMVGVVEVDKDVTDFLPGEVEFNNKLVSRSMHIMNDGTMYLSGLQGMILKYDPMVKNPQKRFTKIAYIPSVPGRQYWNRIDEIVEHNDKLYMGTSDGYIIAFDPKTKRIKNYGKPIRALEVMAMAFSPLDGKLYGVSGGDLEGMSRLWCLDTSKGTFEIDIPVIQVFRNRRPIGDMVCLEDGTIVFGQRTRIGNISLLTPGKKKEWEKSGVMRELKPRDPMEGIETRDLFKGHKMLNVDVYPIPSKMHGGSGYTAIQSDDFGDIYVGGAYYGKFAPLMKLNPPTAQWELVFRSDELTHRYGRGMGIPGKIHTKLRKGSDGKIYGAMKQGYEFHYRIRADVGEAPGGVRGGQYTCHFFSYDPKRDKAEDLGPGLPQEGITAFDVDIDRGFIYGVTVPSVRFLAYDLTTGRVWDAGSIGSNAPARYMTCDKETGKVYHRGEITPEGRHFMTVWDPSEFRLRDYEVIPEKGFKYSHSYAITCGQVGANKLYGSADGMVFEMDLDTSKDGKLHVKPICTVAVDGEVKSGHMYSIELGPDNKIYWACNYGDHGPLPIALFSWDPVKKEKTYLGTCATAGQWLHGGLSQGICFDNEGNMAVHVLYAGINKEQRKHWKVSDDFYYKDIKEKPYYKSFPNHYKGAFYSVFYIKKATLLKD